MFLFNPFEKVFYSYDLKEDYINSGTWPTDGVDVDDETRWRFLAGRDGFIIGADGKGYPVWVPAPAIPHEQLVAEAEAKKQYMISEVHTETEMLRAKLALGRIKDDEKARLNAWLDYLDELEAVDISTAPDIIWPVKPVV
ncbi:tail fiber assembly protein [Morganella morganii]|uniref:tail fiber assembly protein n=1 Tax=Morganella morganii TaxID=582 RepID=UPI00386BCFA2